MLLTPTFALVITLLVSPIIVIVFRSRVTASMNAASSGADDIETSPAEDLPRTTPDLDHLLTMADTAASLIPGTQTDNLLALASRKLRCIAMAYAAGGLVHAAICSAFFLTSFGFEYLRSPALFVPVFLAMALPVVPTLAYVLTMRPVAVVGWTLAGLIVVLLLAGRGRNLVITVAELHLLIPALVFLLFNLRYWRAVAPLVLTLAAGGSFAWLLGLQVGRVLIGIDSPAIWLFRLGGFVLGTGLALGAVRLIGSQYRAKAMSDQELFLDGWWAVFTVIQTALFTIRVGSAVMLTSLVAFPAYYLTKRLLLRFACAKQPADAVPLLLLRVFGHDRRTERLLDGITRRWRCIGPIYLIAGRDVAMRNIEPQDFYMFLSGRLSRAFVRDEADLAARLDALDRDLDPDGRYRINQFFCHRNTWKSVLNGLVERSAAILMDLRGFNAARQGCRYELTRLGEHLGAKPMVLLADMSTDRNLVLRLLGQGRAAVGEIGSSGHQRGYLLNAPHHTASGTLDLVAHLLLGCEPNQPARTSEGRTRLSLS